MLSFLRGFVRSKVSMVVIGFLIIGLTAYALPNVFSGAAPRGLMSAGKRFVVKREVEARVDNYIQLVSQQQGQTVSRQELARAGVVEQILQSMAGETAQLAYADKIGLQASNYAVANMVASAPVFASPLTGKFDPEEYRNYVSRQRKTTRQFEDELRDSLTLQYLNTASSAAVSIPDALARIWVLAQSEQRAFSYVKVSADALSEAAPPSEEDLKAFYEERRNLFEQPERRALSILSLSPLDFIDEAGVTTADIEEAYKQRIKEFSAPESRVLQEVSANDRAVAQSAADVISEDETAESTAASIEGAEYNSRRVTASELTDIPYAQAAFQAEKGDIIGPLQVDDKWIVAIVADIIPGAPFPLSNVSEQIQTDLALPQAERKFDALQETFFDLVGGGFPLEEISAEIGVPLMRYAPVDSQGRTKEGLALGGIINTPNALQAGYSLAFDGETSEIKDDANNGLYVIRLDHIVSTHTPPFEEVRELAQRGYEVVTETQAIEALAEKIAGDARTSGSLSDAAEEAGLTFTRPGQSLTRRNAPEGVSRSMAMTLFNAAQGDIVIAQEQDGSRVIMKLEDITNLDPDMVAAMSSAGKRVISEGIETDIRNAFYTAVYADSEVEMNAALMTEYIESMAGNE